jgi:hypothetical protein
MKNPDLEAALRELELAGIRDVTRANGGKHIQLRWKVGDRDLRIYSVSSTPSDTNARHRVRSEVRNLLRLDGVIVDREPKAAPIRQPSRIELVERRVAKLEQMISEMAERERSSRAWTNRRRPSYVHQT